MKQYKSFISTLLLIAFFCTSSCATIFKGSSADVRVNSTPSNADIYINGIDKGQTPSTLSLSRDNDYVLTFKKDGYEDVKLEVNKKFDGATTILGNLVSFFLLGVVVDVASGAAYSLEPADVSANMEKLEAAGLIKPDNIKEGEIHVVMMTKKQWQAIK